MTTDAETKTTDRAPQGPQFLPTEMLEIQEQEISRLTQELFHVRRDNRMLQAENNTLKQVVTEQAKLLNPSEPEADKSEDTAQHEEVTV